MSAMKRVALPFHSSSNTIDLARAPDTHFTQMNAPCSRTDMLTNRCAR